MRKHRTPQRPLFDLDRPIGNRWSWHVTYIVASSGYPTSCHVSAFRDEAGDSMHGIAQCDVAVGDDLREVIECLATEAMLAACEPTLDGSPSSRRIVFSTTL